MCEGRILESGVGRPSVLDDECCKIRFIALDEGSYLFWYTVPFTVQQAIQTSFSSVTTVLPPLLEATVADFNIKKYLNEFSEETFYIDQVWTMIMLILIELISKKSLLFGTTGHFPPLSSSFYHTPKRYLVDEVLSISSSPQTWRPNCELMFFYKLLTLCYCSGNVFPTLNPGFLKQ